MDTPTTEPESIIAGDSVAWLKTLADYPASAGWVLSYALRGPSKIDIDAAASDDDHLVDIDAADSAAWSAGFYAWTSFVKLDGKRHTISQGAIEVLADPAGIAAGVDQRPHCKKVLDAIEKVLEGKATRDQQEYEIDGVRISRMDIDKLLRWRTVYRSEWNAYIRANKVKKGGARGNRVLVRFTK
jgi:hypothetical protein